MVNTCLFNYTSHLSWETMYSMYAVDARGFLREEGPGLMQAVLKAFAG